MLPHSRTIPFQGNNCFKISHCVSGKLSELVVGADGSVLMWCHIYIRGLTMRKFRRRGKADTSLAKTGRKTQPIVLESLEERLLLSASSLIDSGDRVVDPSKFTQPVSGIEVNLLNSFTANGLNNASPTSVVPEKYENKVAKSIWAEAQAKAGQQTETMMVVIEAADSSEAMVADLEELGFEVGYVGKRSQKTVLSIQADQLNAILDLNSVSSVEHVASGITSAGSYVTQGDSILRAIDVRSSNSAYDGTGVKIGVISDGVDSWTTSSSNGELPGTITVNSSLSGGGDEGTAMLEIIHDLAPGADLYFSAGGVNVGEGGSIDMEASIYWMISQEVDIIIDDIAYFDQPFFSDGFLAAAAEDATDEGILYVSAAGNFANKHYQDQFDLSSYRQPTGMGPFLPWRDYHNFNSGLIVEDPFITIYLESGATMAAQLQWSEAFGSVSSDYEPALFEYVGGSDPYSEITSGVSLYQDPNDPYARLVYTNNTAYDRYYYLAVTKAYNDPAREIELIVVSNNSTYNAWADSQVTENDSVIGHQMSDAVIAVAAVDQETGILQGYSSRGTSTIYTSFSTQTSIDRNVIDLTAVDNVTTSVTGFTDFRGTSAAAPHVAAVAALVLNSNPFMTVSQLTNRIEVSAIDLGAEGYDDKFGHGRVDAVHAVNNHDTANATLVFGDMNEDGDADLIWTRVNGTDRDVAVWYMDDGHIDSSETFATPFWKWDVEGIGDMDRDGQVDLILRRFDTGEVKWWKMDGTTVVGAARSIATSSNTDWHIAGISDINEDGHLDLVWRNNSTHAVRAWLMSSTVTQDGANVVRDDNVAIKDSDGSDLYLTASQSIVGIRDADGDGHADLFIRTTSGADSAMRLDGQGNRLSTDYNIQNTTDTEWYVGRVDDFDGDGVADMYWRNYGTGANQGRNLVWFMERDTSGLLKYSYDESTTLTSLLWEIKDGHDI